MKRLMIICDGMDDEALEELGGKTPKAAANTPNMIKLASLGKTGMLCNCPKELPPGSDTAMLTLFGYNPVECFTGRAAIEASAMNIPLTDGYMAVRANLIGLDDEGKIVSSMAVKGVEAIPLMEKLFLDPEFVNTLELGDCKLYPQASHIQMAVLPEAMEDFKAPHEHFGERLEDILPNNKCLAKLSLKSKEILSETRNALCFWGAGTAMNLSPFEGGGAVISATPTCRGIARLAGLKIPTVNGATGTVNTNYEGKAKTAIEAFESGEKFVAVHIEAPDECSHERNVKDKIESIERIDSRLLPTLMDYLDGSQEDYKVLLLADHPTLCKTGVHSGDPVEYIIYSSNGEYKESDKAIDLLFK